MNTVNLPECSECTYPAVWERRTQFAGNHPYCDSCARKENDFKEDSSYLFWRQLMYNISITAEQLEFMQQFIQNMKIEAGQYNMSESENVMIDSWLTLLEGVGNAS